MLRLIVAFAAVLASFYYGIIYENPTLITIGYGLGTLLILSVIEVIYRMFTIKCFLEIPIAMAEQDVPVTVAFKLKNNSFLPTGQVDIRMTIRNYMARKGHTDWYTVAGVPKGRSRHDSKVLLYGAGSHEVELIRMRVHSLFGLFSLTKKCTDYGSVLVLPEVHPMGISISEGTRNFMGDSDVYDEFRPGHDPGETYEIRGYRPKDKLQSIHWKLSAKTEDLMVKESSMPKACATVMLMELLELDKKRTEQTIDSFLELGASLSFCMMDEQCPHFVAWFSRETGDVRRIRVDDEESFYLFLNHYMRDGVTSTNKNLRDAYREKYRNEWYRHDIGINNRLEVYKDGELLKKLDVKNIKDECEKLELLL